jgi:hypothetical protein
MHGLTSLPIMIYRWYKKFYKMYVAMLVSSRPVHYENRIGRTGKLFPELDYNETGLYHSSPDKTSNISHRHHLSLYGYLSALFAG